MKNFNLTIFKILALYIITSGIFLSIFFSIFYQKEANYIRLSQLTSMYAHYNYILQNILEAKYNNTPLNDENLKSISKELNTNFALIANQNIIFSNLSFDSLTILKQLRKNNYFYTYNDKIFIDFFRAKDIDIDQDDTRKSRHYFKFLKHQKIYIIIESDDLKSYQFQTKPSEYNNLDTMDFKNEIWKLKLQIIFYAIISIILLTIIAYSLIRLVFKNIQDQFNALNDFIKDTTHEINTPLSVILASIKKFDDTNLTQANIKKLNHIKLASKNINHIYQNLIALNFYIQENNTKEKINLKELIEQRLEYFEALITQKNLSIKTEFTKQYIYVNKDEMQILFDNLLNNAIKYSFNNKNIYITLKENFLSIEDEGQGINEQILKQIFTRYKRFNSDQGGFGIGLNLVKQIADKNHFKIKVLSEENKGSKFIISW